MSEDFVRIHISRCEELNNIGFAVGECKVSIILNPGDTGNLVIRV